MGWTKRQYVVEALEILGLASYVYDLQPENYISALRKLDGMLSTWNANGVRIGWQIPKNPENSELDAQTNVPDYANEAIYTNLAIRLAPVYGKIVSPELSMMAKSSYSTLMNRCAYPVSERRYPANSLAGAGHKTWRSSRDNFTSQPADTLNAGDDATIIYE